MVADGFTDDSAGLIEAAEKLGAGLEAPKSRTGAGSVTGVAGSVTDTGVT